MKSKYCVNESAGLLQSYEHHDYMELLNSENGCTAGCRTGLLYYRQTEFIQGGVHEDQEGFYVLEGHGEARVGSSEFEISEGSSFIAPAGKPHFICRDADCEYVKLFFFHAAAEPNKIK